MTEREFFDDSWGNRPVSFSFPQSHWILVKKLSDHNTQLTPYYALEYPDARGAAYGTFLARNVDKTDEEAIIRIILQIPSAGLEIASATERARKAVRTLPRYGQDMIDALSLLKLSNSKSGPRLLSITSDAQGQNDPGPSGFITCLLLEKLPGKQMGPWFWDLDRDQRDFIRARFKAAWIECVGVSGYDPIASPTKFFWDDATGRLAFYDFLTGRRDDDENPWQDCNFLLWGLAKAPPGYRWTAVVKKHEDMSSWTL